MVGNYPSSRPYSPVFAWGVFVVLVSIAVFLLGYGFFDPDRLTVCLGWGTVFAAGIAAVILGIFASEDENDWFVFYSWAGVFAIVVGFFGGIITATVFLLN